MKIAIIDNYDSFVYNLIRYLEEESEGSLSIMRNDEIDEQKLEDADAILLSPGPGIPSEAGELMRIIKDYHKEKAILGVCLGHQALAEFFGNKLELCTAPFHGESSEIEILENAFLFKDLKIKVTVGRYHSWRTNRDLKAPLIVTALSEQNEVMAFRHENLPISGIQFHPESILTPDGRKIIRNWIAEIQVKQEILENNL
ncbi:MAG: anthranilate synthase component II [Flavobacteriia bacterium]